MVRTSTADQNGGRCPKCDDLLTSDNSGRGFVRHTSNKHCHFEQGEKDDYGTSSTPSRKIQAEISQHVPTEGLRVCGYSERGIISSLFYEINYAPNAMHVLSELLSLVKIPNSDFDFSNLVGAEMLIEHTLSDFGDPDVILLLHFVDRRCAVFIEGKVKPSQTNSWSIREVWKGFLARKKNNYKELKLDSSNLFTQFYHKVRFVAGLREGGLSRLKLGLEFPRCSTKTTRKLGTNSVVLKTASMIEEYIDNVFYIALVPDSPTKLEAFFQNELLAGPATDVDGWDTEDWGYLAWEQVEEFCRVQDLKSTLRVFEFNRGQIY